MEQINSDAGCAIAQGASPDCCTRHGRASRRPALNQGLFGMLPELVGAA
jgi:hypothetical protein